MILDLHSKIPPNLNFAGALKDRYQIAASIRSAVDDTISRYSEIKILGFPRCFFATLRLHFFFELLSLALKIPPEIRAELRRG